MTDTKNAKRKLSNIDFSREGAHIALCHKDQGVANKQDFALVLKSQNYSDEFIEKIQQVRVTMELPDFLSKFFYIWSEDAKVLAYMMGYVEPADTAEEEKLEAEDEFQEWISERMEAFEIIKAASEAKNISAFMATLKEDEYLSLLKDQEQLEKAIASYDKKKKDDADSKKKPKTKTTRSFENANSMVSKSESSNVAPATAVETPIASGDKGVTNPVVKTKQKEKLMTQETQTVKQEVKQEMVEKSAFEAIQKQAAEQAEILKAALAELEVFKAEKAALVAKTRKQALVDAMKAEDKAEQLFKAVSELADEKFEEVVRVVKALTAQVEQSDLFVEKGAAVDTQPEQKESAVAKLIKKQQAKK